MGASDLALKPSNYQTHHDLRDRMVLRALLCVKEMRQEQEVFERVKKKGCC